MKKIIYTRVDGGLSVRTLAEGARLAFSITLVDGTRFASEEQVVGQGGNRTVVKAAPVDRIFRRWPVVGAVAEWAESEDEFVARIAAKNVPITLVNPPAGITPMMSRADALKQGFSFTETPYQFVDPSEIPTDRTFRDAWETNGAGVQVNMPKARELHKTRLRELRAPKMAALDVLYMRADEAGDTAEKQRIATLKQVLRDVTADPRIEAAQTPETLKTVTPEALR